MGEKIIAIPTALVMCPWTRAPPAKTARWEATATSSGKTHNPDNVLFADGVGATLRTWLMDWCDLHTILRLPTGIFYAQGVKTNVLFFVRGKTDRRNTRRVWIYDMRGNMPAFGKTRPLMAEDFNDFEAAYGDDPTGKARRRDQGENGRFRRFTRAQIKERNDSLAIAWLPDDGFDEEQLSEPDEIAAAIIGHLRNAIEEIEALSEGLEPDAAPELP